ncbi:MAG TPA: helix-turn-helix domain-containing protein [Candidatus Saccharimonadales bacterium]|nr:helix-turn-helix domain-containing protein [Candidatus Saccharimonadales bacterium]
MLQDTAAVRSYFAKLGFEPEIADIYLALYSGGPQTISEVSRSSGVERTRIYRLIDTLLASNLIEMESHYKRGVMKAAPIANLTILISQREQELKSLQDELGLIEQVLNRNSLSSPATKVQFYHGAEGVKQMYWNETKAAGEILSLLHENMQIKTNSRFFERWVRACNQHDLRFRGIVSDTFLDSQKQWYTSHDNERLQNWEQRYIAPSSFAITHGMVIYDSVVAYFNWKDNEIFGIEIHNKEIADMQRQLFELLWATAKATQ